MAECLDAAAPAAVNPEPLPPDILHVFGAAVEYYHAEKEGDTKKCKAVLQGTLRYLNVCLPNPPHSTSFSDSSPMPKQSKKVVRSDVPHPVTTKQCKAPKGTLSSVSNSSVSIASHDTSHVSPGPSSTCSSSSSKTGVSGGPQAPVKPLTLSTVERAQLKATLPPVFIPSKGRARHPSGTVQLLLKAGVPFTVVVEPQEADEYCEWLEGAACQVAVLQKDDQGVSYCRNYILGHLTNDFVQWLWIMDDDISGFREKHAIEKRTYPICPWTMFAKVNPHCAIDNKVVLLGLEYDQFAWNARNDEWAFDGYTNVCVLLNRTALKQADIFYHFRVREDYDLSLQCITKGYKTQRLRCISFRAPKMGHRKGGMWQYYKDHEEEIIASNQSFIERWYPLCEHKLKGKEGRPDIRVKWKYLRGLMPLYHFYKAQREKTEPNPVASKKRKRQ